MGFPHPASAECDQDDAKDQVWVAAVVGGQGTQSKQAGQGMAAQGAAATTEGGGRAQAALEEALERVQCPESGGDGGRDVEALEEAASAMERVARGHAELLQLLVCARERAELAHAEARTAAKALSPEPYTSHDKKVKELRRQGLAAAYIEVREG
ncbi:hypothetical protein CYMTET_10788 [Cymbomonas tetramitiformis]|uniref:Uncharacterized protein n=1 Tax=Cymbomonas tetramitiformis TaxID=36881 RepID=A0AAE0GP26_9CHLO|nr:hypothetical protein CYMTET_10788 [Cymbomonas tetramitiformis]